jgi:hypothetical protein
LSDLAKAIAAPLAFLLLAGCASGSQGAHTEAIHGHVYDVPLDEVLSAASSLLTQRGWHVERAGDQLGTNWRRDATGALTGLKVEGESIDEGHCTIRIQRLEAATFGATGTSRAGSAGAGPGEGNFEGADATTTLGEPPAGTVSLPRGQDEALEWALLQRLDPHAAEAIGRADARATPSTPPAAADAGAAPASPPLPAGVQCEAVSGLEAAIHSRRLVVLGDIPGTNEIPDFVVRLACQAARTGVPTVVALELFRVDQDWVDTYLASQGSRDEKTAFIQVSRSFKPQLGGAHGSAAVLELLDKLRVLRDAGLPLRVIAFDEPPQTATREKTRASTLERFRRSDPDAFVVVVVERGHAGTLLAPSETADHAPLGYYLARWGLRPLVLDVRTLGGQTWTCVPPTQGGCASVAVPPQPSPPAPTTTRNAVELYPSQDARGFQGDFDVGRLTPSFAPQP